MKKIIATALTLLFLASCGGSTTDIINPDADLLYFYGGTCPHCQELNAKLKDIGGIEQFSVEKREVYYNKANQNIFQALIKDNDIDQREAGVPFVFNKATGEHVVGVDPAFNMMTGVKIEGAPVETVEEEITQ